MSNPAPQHLIAGAAPAADATPHRRKMQRKAAARADLYAAKGAAYARHLAHGGRLRHELSVLRQLPIWPKGKVAKPGRMG